MLNPHCVLISFYSLSIEHFSLSIMHPHTTIFTIFFLFIFLAHNKIRSWSCIYMHHKKRRNCSPTYSSSSLSTCYGNIITTDFFSASSTGKGEMLMMMMTMIIIVSLVEWQRRSLSLFSFFLVVIAVQYCYQYIVMRVF